MKSECPNENTIRRGRPTRYGKKIAESIIQAIAEGQSLRAVCRLNNMPARSTVMKWLIEYPEFSDQYKRACVFRADDIFEQMLEIADGNCPDSPDKKSVHRDKLRIDTRKWVLCRMVPKKYRDDCGDDEIVQELEPPKIDLSFLNQEERDVLRKVLER